AFPLPGESSHWQYKFPLPVKVVPTARRLEMPLSGVCAAIEEMMKKLPSEGQSFHASSPSRLCAQAQSVDDMPFHKRAYTEYTRWMFYRGPIESKVKHLFGYVVRAMMSPGGSIVASLENVNGFLAVNTPPDDLICIDFKQDGVVPKVMLHIFEEFVLLLGQHALNNEVPRMEENPPKQSRLGIFFSKEILKGGMNCIHNALVHNEGNLGNGEWSSPVGLKLARENLQSRIKEEDSTTNVENAVFDLGLM
nr:hypothetical protein [Tanacetum cinerariifolium]